MIFTKGPCLGEGKLMYFSCSRDFYGRRFHSSLGESVNISRKQMSFGLIVIALVNIFMASQQFKRGYQSDFYNLNMGEKLVLQLRYLVYYHYSILWSIILMNLSKNSFIKRKDISFFAIWVRFWENLRKPLDRFTKG